MPAYLAIQMAPKKQPVIKPSTAKSMQSTGVVGGAVCAVGTAVFAVVGAIGWLLSPK